MDSGHHPLQPPQPERRASRAWAVLGLIACTAVLVVVVVSGM